MAYTNIVICVASIFSTTVLYEIVVIIPDQGYIYYAIGGLIMSVSIVIIWGIQDFKYKVDPKQIQEKQIENEIQVANPSEIIEEPQNQVKGENKSKQIFKLAITQIK